ncbi:MAG: sugar phosphate isomerase/epimerase [Acidobacteria bacterium]|nr:sugar phosphate isomerase/epimerase [Acidobacteriota bacterium]
MLNRRTFLRQTACSTVGIAASALALNSLTTEAQAAKLSKIGVQLYTVRAEMAKDFDGSLKKIAELGFKEVEFAGYYNRTPQQIKTLLGQLGLDSPSAHVPLADLRNNLPKAIETAKIIGHRYIICPFLMPDERKTLDQYKQLIATLNKAGDECKKAGLQLAYHNHDFEFAAIDGKVPYDLMLAETDKNLVKMELDLYWIVKANQDPLAYMSKHPNRFALFHVKDLDKTPKRGITEVGNGVIDFKTIFAKTPKGAIKHYLVEQDVCPGSPFDSLKFSIDYLKKLEF